MDLNEEKEAKNELETKEEKKVQKSKKIETKKTEDSKETEKKNEVWIKWRNKNNIVWLLQFITYCRIRDVMPSSYI